jgi:hypothetical protein
MTLLRVSEGYPVKTDGCQALPRTGIAPLSGYLWDLKEVGFASREHLDTTKGDLPSRMPVMLVAECCVRPSAASVSSPPLDFPFGPAFGPAFRQVKAFGPWAERFLRQELFASGAELLAIFPDSADTVREGFIRSQFDRVCGHAQHGRNMP